jgi:hypothetical protein
MTHRQRLIVSCASQSGNSCILGLKTTDKEKAKTVLDSIKFLIENLQHSRRPAHANQLTLHRTNPYRLAALMAIFLGFAFLSSCVGLAQASPDSRGGGSVPSISTQPVSADVTAGQSATFSVTATGTHPLGYQWAKNGTPISGANSISYTTPPTTSSDNRALFTVAVTNNAGSATSNTATLNVAGTTSGTSAVAPSITTQPLSADVSAGQSAIFFVASAGTAPLSYQWVKNGITVSGATAASYTTPPTTLSDNRALFTVVVSNSAGSAVSGAATLNVSGATVGAPSITTQPVSANVSAGQTATFSVAAAGTSPFSYQWQKSGISISGANAASYTTPATALSDNGTLFRVVVSNSAGSATSNAATLNVGGGTGVAPAVTTQPVSADVNTGQTATFFVTTSGTAPLSYQWQKNGIAVSGANAASYTTSPTIQSDDRALFTVAVSNSAGSATSNTATLNVHAVAGVTIAVSPTSATVALGTTQQFIGTVNGSSNTAVTWGVSGAGCSGAACGSVSSAGLYTPPTSIPSPATVNVMATSVADSTKSASASVTDVATGGVLVSVSPTTSSVPAAGLQAIAATVTGTSNTAVTWSLSGAGCSGSACGSISSSGLSAVYSAPLVAPSPAGVSVIATSVADSSKSATAVVTVASGIVVTVSPSSASLATGATQQFSASVTGTSNTAATWTVKGSGCAGAACGTIGSTGLYTAPSSAPSPASVTVIAASAADPTKTNSVTVSIGSGAATSSNGSLSIPAGHPRLFWNSSRIAAASAWVASTSYPGVTVDFRPLDYYDLAFTCLIMNNGTACSTAIADAVAFVPSSSNGIGVGDDNMRRNGEWIMLVRDWLAPGCGKAQCLTSSQAATIDSNWSIWQSNQDSPAQTWGNVGMPANNYFAGQYRNDFDFGIASYNENPSAGTNLNYAVVNRWNDLLNFASPTGTGKNAGFGYGLHSQEGGGEYGRYSLNYYTLALASSAVLGRDMWTETTAFKSGVLQTIYNTMLTQTTGRGIWDGFTWADDENWSGGSGCGYQSHNGPDGHGGCGMSSQYYGDFMQAAATEYNSTSIGKYARQWIATVNPAIGPLFKSVDPGGSSLALSTLPLDYYSPGAQYMYAHDNWTSNGTVLLWQMGLNQGGNPDPSSALGTGHYHQDAGTFQVSRKGVNIIRETMSYGQTVAGYNGSGTVDAATGFGHNQPLIGGQASINVFGGCANGPGVVSRLESQPGYAFAATDLTPTYKNTVCDSGHPSRQNPYVVSAVREYYYFRSINVLVIVDRLQSDAATRSTTFLSHCETNPVVSSATIKCVDGSQEALYTALVPAAPSIAIVAENANSATNNNWQYRIEANNSNPGNVVSYNIYTIQLGDASSFAALTPRIVDSAPGSPSTGTFTITLDGNDSLSLNKGITSSGGTINAGGVTNPLTTTVQSMSITDAGPVWGAH